MSCLNPKTPWQNNCVLIGNLISPFIFLMELLPCTSWFTFNYSSKSLKQRTSEEILSCFFYKNTTKWTAVSSQLTSFCLFPRLQKESQKNEAAQAQRRHERKKEKRKKSARLLLQAQEQSLDTSQTQPGTTGQTEDTHVQPPPKEAPPVQTEKPPKTVIKTEPKTPKARAHVHSPKQFEVVADQLLWFVVNILKT